MDIIKENAKAIAGALTTLVVTIINHLIPNFVDPTLQSALEVLFAFLVIPTVVWLVPNKPKEN